jgi:hypothetical protein
MKITKKELEKKYHKLQEENKDLEENYISMCKNYEELEKKFNKLYFGKIKDMIEKNYESRVEYLEKRIKNTQGDIQKRYIDCLNKLIKK